MNLINEERFVNAWRNIDCTPDPKHFARLMDLAGVDDDPGYETVIQMLEVGEGLRILDVGCGTGGAARAFTLLVGKTGWVVGLDVSHTMIGEARRRNQETGASPLFYQGDARRLPFADNSFDRSYALRFFEIIDEPLRILREMHRIVRPGGRVFVIGPDVETWTFDVNDRVVTRNIVRYICDREVNGWIGRQLPRLFEEAGFTEIEVVPATAVVSSFNLMSDLYLSDFVRRAQASGAVTHHDANAWLGDLRRQFQAGRFPHSQTDFRVCGRKPE